MTTIECGFQLLIYSVFSLFLQSQGDDNIALNTDATQSSTFNSIYTASRAVDGNTETSSSTLGRTKQWWRTELGSPVYIKEIRIQPYSSTYAKEIFILTSTQPQPEEPSPTGDNWKIVYYISGSVTQSETFMLYTGERIRHVALYSLGDSGLALKEVEIYSYYSVSDGPTRIVLNTITSSSSTGSAWRAADGNLNMFNSVSNIFQSDSDGSNWWRAQLQQQCGNCRIVIYPSLDRGKQIENSDFSDLTGYSVLTSQSQSQLNNPSTPSLQSADWTSCFESTPSEIQRGPLHVVCQAFRWLAIFKSEGKLSLTEVQVFFGTEPSFGGSSPQLTVSGNSQSCVRLSWPAAPAANYQSNSYRWKCESDDDWSRLISPTSDVKCGYTPRQTVGCSVVAVGDGGVSPSLEGSGRTLCPGPTGFSFQLDTEKYTYSTSVGDRWEILVTDVRVTHNCDSLNRIVWTLYQVVHPSLPGPLLRNVTKRNRNDPNFDNLDPVTTYRVSASAFNNDEQQVMLMKDITTGEQAPVFGDAKVSLEAISPNSVQLSWDSPQYPNGQITGYQYLCTGGSWSTVDPDVRDVTVSDFTPYQQVSCSIYAINNAGGDFKTPASIRTYCDKPSNARSTISLFRESTNSPPGYRLEAGLESGVEHNCRWMSHFTVTLSVDGKSPTSINQTDSTRIVVFMGLPAITKYTVTVVVINNAGNQSTPDKESGTTGELAPADPPQDIKTDQNSTCISLEWSPPTKPNGKVVNYQVRCTPISNGNDHLSLYKNTSESRIDICELKSGAQYNCSITASTGVGIGPPATALARTNFEVEKSLPPSVTTDEINPSITLTINLVEFKDTTPDVMYYQVIVESVDGNLRQKRSAETSKIDPDRLVNYTHALELGISYYIAGRLNKTQYKEGQIEFEVGDDKSYGDYENPPLIRGKDYKFHYSFTVNQDGRPITQVQPFNQIYRVPELVSQRPNLLYLAALAVIVPIVIVVVVLLIFYKRRKANKAPSADGQELNALQKPESSAAESQSRSKLPPEVPKKPVRINRYDPDSVYENSNPFSSKMTAAKDRINFSPLALEDYIKSNGGLLTKQYAEIERVPVGSMEVASLAENKGKNRYRGLYPVDEYRVVLEQNPNGSDYINASYIHGFNQPREYIAAMAPNPLSLVDFWLMIWQQRVPIIVMVTNLVEDAKTKSEQYWPADLNLSQSYGDITVRCTSEETWADYVLRTFVAIRDGVTRKIMQFQYTSWPDHGVPRETAPFVLFYQKVKAARFRKTGPIVIHCSAGIGRTGAFIALDYLLKEGTTNGNIDILAAVKNLRIYRPSMIQKEEQYVFLHHALLQYLATADFVTDTSAMVKKLSEFSSAKTVKKTAICQEFKEIEKQVKNRDFVYSAAEMSANRSKNRSQKILASDGNRAFLQDGETDYINAVLVNGYRLPNCFAATQLPLRNTLTDFWELIKHMKAATIIQLDSSETQFYPEVDGQSQSLAPYIVERTSTNEQDHVTIIGLSVSDGKKMMTNISVVVCKAWTTRLPSETVIAALYGALKQCQQKTGNIKTVVSCMDGATKCGLFISVSNCLEKLEVEQEVDVFNPVLMTRLRRPEFINSIDDYVYIYKALSNHVESFSEYSNFR